MPIPLLWLGLGAGALFATQQWHKDRQRHQIKFHPGETDVAVRPQNGAVVCCGIYGAFDHSGIWVEDNVIERAGNGLVRAISPQRFTARRSGNTIFVACGEEGEVLADPSVAEKAAAQVYQYEDYHLLKNNCHQFVAGCLTPNQHSITFFSELNQLLSAHYHCRLSWHPILL
ncbi:hypothetical protein [Lacimicrobium sp. SS2-24]|uniref:hypothetical protein n=1 Tax=Lacimicrobium sp. SS2-24 TaxID=2005569 RepID=UPI000B4BC32C|nr:hypothetical protein [Lacimicrobium sp. SS2-24]